jgi:hypothetical protein
MESFCHRSDFVFKLNGLCIFDASANSTATAAESCGAQFASWREFRHRRQTNSRSDDCCRVGTRAAHGPPKSSLSPRAVRRWTRTSRSSATTLSRTTHEMVKSRRSDQRRQCDRGMRDNPRRTTHESAAETVTSGTSSSPFNCNGCRAL